MLASFFGLAFIVTTYWCLPASLAGKMMVLALSLVLGALWVLISAAELEARCRATTTAALAILVAGLAVLNYRPLSAPFAWRGDEIYHVGVTRNLLGLVVRVPPAVALFGVMTWALCLGLAWRTPKWALALAGVMVAGVVGFFLEISYPGSSLRYPYVGYWFVALVPAIAGLMGHPFHEALFRVLPLLSVAGVIWVFLRHLGLRSRWPYLLWGTSVAVIPLAFYYSSILYLEFPAVFLMTVVCLNLEQLLDAGLGSLRRSAGWYALILIGFIKETTVPFLVCFLACRTVVVLGRQWRSGGGDAFLSACAEEVQVAFATMFPVSFYILLRVAFGVGRGFSPSLAGLRDPLVYAAIARSLQEQFGIFVLFFLAGCILMLRRKEYAKLTFLLLTIAATVLFHAADNRIYAGYSRFNLFLLPSMLAGSAVLVSHLANTRKVLATSLACVAIGAGLWMSPVNADGTKTPLWGNYLVDTSEHYYPYPEALSWLKQTHDGERILFAGLSFGYAFGFYFGQLHWTPQYAISTDNDPANEGAALMRALDSTDADVVVFHVLGQSSRLPEQYRDFRQARTVKNDAHALVIYDRRR